MNNKILVGLVCLFSQTLYAQTLQECETKITGLLSQVKTQQLRVLALNEDGTPPSKARVDTYHMSADNLCGVEFVKETGLLTVTKFKELETHDFDLQFRDIVKFESISLNGSDPTRTNGRVKAKVECSMTKNSVRYVTKVPVLTDGVRTPWVIEELNVKFNDNIVNFSLRATVTPVNKVFRSITDCALAVEEI